MDKWYQGKAFKPGETTISDPKTTRGRKRDPGREGAILDAALNMFADLGYERMTMEWVALHAKAGKATIYRRWRSKAELVLDAVTRSKIGQIDVDNLPDTGALRSDLLALFAPSKGSKEAYRLHVVTGVAAMLWQNPELAGSGHTVVIDCWAAAMRILINRAVKRGEVSCRAHINIDAVYHIIPALAAYKFMIRHESAETAYIASLIDSVLLPVLRYQIESPRALY